MRVEPVISRRMRKTSVASSEVLADERGKVCSASKSYSRRFSDVSWATKNNVAFTGRQKVSVSVARTVMASRKSDRKSTRLNSSHSQISYAVFCLKKKKA